MSKPTLTEKQKQACRDAAEYISEHGHCKENYFDDGGQHSFAALVTNERLTPPACALGANRKGDPRGRGQCPPGIRWTPRHTDRRISSGLQGLRHSGVERPSVHDGRGRHPQT